MISRIRSLSDVQLTKCIRNGIIASGSVSLVWFILYWIYNTVLHESLSKNIVFYGLMCLAFAAVFLVSAYKVKDTKPKEENKTAKIFGFGLAIIALAITQNVWALDTLSGQLMTMPVFLITIVASVVLFALGCRQINKSSDILQPIKNDTIFKVVFWAAAIGLCAYTAWFVYGAYNEDAYSLYHKAAYTYEIYARYDGVPYTNLTSSVYGHWGLLALPIFKILGGCNVSTINLYMMGLQVATVLLFAGAIRLLVKNKTLSCISLILCAIAPLCHSNAIYWQGIPHRSFLAALVVFSFALLYKKQLPKAAQTAIKIFVPAFAVLWVPDFGLVAWIAFAMYEVVQHVTEQEKPAKEFLKGLGMATIYATVSLLLAFAALNIYNSVVGGPFITTELFYPLVNGFVDELSRPLASILPTAGHFIFWIAIFLLVLLAVIFRKLNRQNAAIIGIVLFTLGTYAQFMSRAYIGHAFMYYIATLSILLAWAFDNAKDKHKAYLWMITAFTLCVSVMFTATVLPSKIGWRSDDDTIAKAAEYIQTQYGADVYLVGPEANEIGHEIGSNNIDEADFIHLSVAGGYDECMARLRQQDKFVLITQSSYFFGLNTIDNTDQKQIVQNDFDEIYNEFRLVNESTFGNIVVEYYERKDAAN